MPVSILSNSPDLIQIKRAYKFQKVVGLFLMASSIIVFVLVMILHPEKKGKTISLKLFSVIIILLLIGFLIREFYFFYIDRNILLSKSGESFIINNRSFLQTDFHSVLIIEYNGVGTMEKGYNVFVKLVKGKNIPIAIRVSKDDKERVTKVLCKFLNVQKLKKRKWYIK